MVDRSVYEMIKHVLNDYHFCRTLFDETDLNLLKKFTCCKRFLFKDRM